MVITNWRQAAPTIVHQYGIDYKLLKGQADFSPDVPNYCMRGMLYVAYAMLQTGKSYEAMPMETMRRSITLLRATAP